MKKNILYILFLCFGILPVVGQNNIYKTNVAKINFDAAKSSIEPIQAVNVKAKIILNSDTGEIASLMNMSDFSFPNKLMQEHFNENYIESDKYPKATFSGKINDFSTIDFSKEQNITVTGHFKIHGETQKKTIPLTVVKQKNSYNIQGKFMLQLKDFKIKIPSIMFYKIAEEVEVKIQADIKDSQ